MVNVNLTYDNDRLGSSMGLFYNRVGETLFSGAAVGGDGTPNVFEDAFSTLDLTLSQKLTKIRKCGVSVSLKAKNLLRPEARRIYRAPDGQEVVKSERTTPPLVSLGASFES